MFNSFFRRFRRASQMPRHLDPPTGQFDLLGTRCVGWVETQDGTVGETYRLVLRQVAKTLAEFQSNPADDRHHAHFALELAGLVDNEALLRESVQLIAIDHEGNEGRLTLRGATQVELIQRHMGTPQDITLDLDFSEGGNAEPLLGQGWSIPESGWRWTDGPVSEVSFEHPAQGGDYEVTLLCQPFLHAPGVLEQRAEYYIGEDLIYAGSKDTTTGELTRFKVPGDLFASGGRKTLWLCHPDAARPSELTGAPDARQLGYAYKKLVIARLKPTT